MDETLLEIARLLKLRDAELPEGAYTRLSRHRRCAMRLLDHVKSLRMDQYVEWQYEARTRHWAQSAADVDDCIRLAADRWDLHSTVRWTGRWRVATLSPDVFFFLYGQEPEGKA